MKYFLPVCCCLLLSRALHGQELFPLEEPASTLPAHVSGIRIFDQSYTDPGGKLRTLAGLKLMYGLTPKLTVELTGTASNHHSKDLPPEFPDHNTPQIGVSLPMRINGADLYAKYRIFSSDGRNSHLRAAAYGEYSYLSVAHDEAEPTLIDDTKGFAAGFITTYLYHNVAVSFTGGVILPFTYHGIVPDEIAGLPVTPATVKYGRAANYTLSFGYLLLPRAYKSYDQTNVNLYFELIGKSYGEAKIYLDNVGQPGTPYEVTGTGSKALGAGHYIEAHPGAQLIIKSNLRIDGSVGFPVISKSFTHFYPLYTLGIQRYFFGRKKS